MSTNLHKKAGTLTAVLAMAGTALFVTAGAANAQSLSTPAATAGTAVVFDLNGTYSDGGSARPVISDVNDILTVDMSSQHRPNATGVVISSDTILVTFPDDATYAAKLQAPGTIRWSNGSTWQKTRVVPDVRDDTVAGARSVLTASGFRVGTVSSFVDRTCNNIGTVGRQSPGAGTSAIPGTAVNLWVGSRPPTPCP
jgi:hypothetical protein